MVRQKYNPFAVDNETHCGDCDKVLTSVDGRDHDVYFDRGVRCEQCYNNGEEKKADGRDTNG